MENNNYAKNQAISQLESVVELANSLTKAKESGDSDLIEELNDKIQDDALEVNVRSGWHSVCGDGEPEEYMILLCTGGPAVRITGKLGGYNSPETAKIEYQDWGTEWTELPTTKEQKESMIEYASAFYYS